MGIVLFGDAANFINDSHLIHQFEVEHPFEYVNYWLVWRMKNGLN